ncbi:MAG: hypothetical protein WBV98_09855, partial [Candidatus Sulfotelmatobacter sp.]
LIASLKTLTWPRQNPAIDSFDVAQAGKYSADSLFVIGRNIYQSACGCANSANAYIKNFLAKTNGLAEDKRKALLDGMLFEVFFDSKGELRRMFKTERFAEVFRLQQFDELSGSFDFISECLLLNANRFYSIPGKKHHVAVDVVSSSKKTDTPTIKAVHIAGTDILWMEDEFFAEDPGKTEYRSIQVGKFEEKLSDEMVVPAHLLKITYDFDRDKVGAVKFPRGYTLRKR